MPAAAPWRAAGELNDTHLESVEIAAVSSFLSANIEAFSPLLISANALHQLLMRSTVLVCSEAERSKHFIEKGQPCESCVVVLHGRLHVVCGSEEFESDRGPWTVLGAPSLRLPHYMADFTARVMEPSRLLQISRANYEETLRQESETLAAAVRAELSGAYFFGSSQRSPVARVACKLNPDLAAAYTEHSQSGSNDLRASFSPPGPYGEQLSSIEGSCVEHRATMSCSAMGNAMGTVAGARLSNEKYDTYDTYAGPPAYV